MPKAPDPVARLEKARASLQRGRLRACLALLPARSSLPAILRPERDLAAAEALRGQGFFSRAEALYRPLLAAGPASDPPLFVEAALGSAAGLRSLGATSPARRRLAAARKAGVPAYLSRIRLEEALVDRAAGRYAKSLALLRGILRGNMARGDWGEAAFVLWAIGGAERFRGRLRASDTAFRRSLRLAERMGDREAQGYACFGLGGVKRILGRLEESARYYTRAGRIFSRSEDIFAQAYACCGLANALRQLGRLSRAERLYRRSHALYSRLQDSVDLAYVDWGLGQIRLQQGRLGQSLPFLRKALSAFTRSGEHRGIILARMSLARALHARGDTSSADAHFASARLLAEKSGSRAHLEIFT